MYPWYEWEEYCDFVYLIWQASPGRRPKPVKRKHGRHCLRWLCDYDAHSMSGETSVWLILNEW